MTVATSKQLRAGAEKEGSKEWTKFMPGWSLNTQTHKQPSNGKFKNSLIEFGIFHMVLLHLTIFWQGFKNNAVCSYLKGKYRHIKSKNKAQV